MLTSSSNIFLISGCLAPNVGISLTAASTALTPPLNSGIGCTSESPLDVSGFVGFGVSPSGLSGTVGGVVSFTPPVNSGTSLTGASWPLEAIGPLNSGTTLTGAS